MLRLQLENIEDMPLRDVVYETLRHAIFRGDLKPGERLQELQLSAQLGVSRTPVREAIHMLKNDGLVKITPRRGAEVAHMTLEDMEDVLEVRGALDEFAVRLACRRINEEQLGRLAAAAQEFADSIDDDDVRKIAMADVKFHDIIYEATDNPKLVSLLNNLREQIYRYRVEYIKERENCPMLVEEHAAILDALRKRNQATAVQAMHKHLLNQAMAVKNIIISQQKSGE